MELPLDPTTKSSNCSFAYSIGELSRVRRLPQQRDSCPCCSNRYQSVTIRLHTPAQVSLALEGGGIAHQSDIEVVSASEGLHLQGEAVFVYTAAGMITHQHMTLTDANASGGSSRVAVPVFAQSATTNTSTKAVEDLEDEDDETADQVGSLNALLSSPSSERDFEAHVRESMIENGEEEESDL